MKTSACPSGIIKSVISLIFYFSLCFIAQSQYTFKVDMTDPYEKELFNPEEGDKVLLRGSFCDWSGEAFIMKREGKSFIFSGWALNSLFMYSTDFSFISL